MCVRPITEFFDLPNFQKFKYWWLVITINNGMNNRRAVVGLGKRVSPWRLIFLNGGLYSLHGGWGLCGRGWRIILMVWCRRSVDIRGLQTVGSLRGRRCGHRWSRYI